MTKTTVRKLRGMARTMTQAEAARSLGVERQWVHKLALRYGVVFRRRAIASKRPLCGRCSYRKDGLGCLRCKWTPRRIKKLRKRYGLSQVRMSYEVFHMNVWTCGRWENANVQPSRSSLEKLEAAERNTGRGG